MGLRESKQISKDCAFVSVPVLSKTNRAAKRYRHRRTSCNEDVEIGFFGKRSIMTNRTQKHLWKLCSTNLSDHQESDKQPSPQNIDGQSADKWRPHSILNNDKSIDEFTDQIPVELVEGYVENDVTRSRFDLDADESMIMLRLRRSLHQDDAKRIFDNPGVGDM